MARPLCVRLCAGPSSATLARRILRDGPPRNDEHTVCQVAVFAVLTDGQRHAPVDMRLYLPQRWIEDPKRCNRAGIPVSARQLRSKAELALEIVRAARARGMRFAWVGVDGGYGQEPAFLRALDDAGEVFVADVHSSQMIWTEPPGLHVPARKSARGRHPTRQRAAAEPLSVEKLVSRFRAEDWTRCLLRDSTRGPLQVDIAHRRGWVWGGGGSQGPCWHLLLPRRGGAPPAGKKKPSQPP